MKRRNIKIPPSLGKIRARELAENMEERRDDNDSFELLNGQKKKTVVFFSRFLGRCFW